MELDLLALIVLAVIVGAVAWAVTRSSDRLRPGVQQAAIESEAVRVYYQQALRMARILDRIERDEMIAVTIPAEMRLQIRTLVETFFEGDGEGGGRPLRR